MLAEIDLAVLAPPSDTADRQQGDDKSAPPGTPAQPEHSDMEFPAWVWIAMFACYAVFFGGLVLATRGDMEAGFVIAISAAYTLMYFGTASLLVALKRDGHRSPFARGAAPLATLTGPMTIGAVVGQVLLIPLCLALFGLAIAVIVAIVA